MALHPKIQSLINSKRIILGLAFLVLIFGLSTAKILAATMYLSAPAEYVTIGDKFNIEVRIDSEGTAVNASDGTIKFSKDILEVTEVDRSKSAFTFWLEDPSYSNETGVIRFFGVNITGGNGKSLEVMKISFRVRGTGSANVIVEKASVAASDGTGTNVLSTIK